MNYSLHHNRIFVYRLAPGVQKNESHKYLNEGVNKEQL